MRISGVLRVVALTVVACAFAVVLSACGSRQTLLRQGYGGQAADEISLDEALTELEEYPCPEGVDVELWGELKDALGEALAKRASSVGAIHELPSGEKAGRGDPALQGENRFVSTPPTGEANKVNDLALTDNGSGTYTFTWHYRNLGDYDQNGTVGVSDITPIAMHFGETYDIADVNCLLAVIDGSGNGRIGIEDITSIAMNYGVECVGYRIDRARVSDGLFSPVGEASIDEATGEGRRTFSFIQGDLHPDFRVVPIDSDSVEGEPSSSLVSARGFFLDNEYGQVYSFPIRTFENWGWVKRAYILSESGSAIVASGGSIEYYLSYTAYFLDGTTDYVETTLTWEGIGPYSAYWSDSYLEHDVDRATIDEWHIEPLS